MTSSKEVLDRIGWSLYRDFQLYSSLLETKPGCKTLDDLKNDIEITSLPQLMHILRRNVRDETIKQELIDDPTRAKEKVMAYSILFKGENVRQAIKQLYEAFTGKELRYTKPTHS